MTFSLPLSPSSILYTYVQPIWPYTHTLVYTSTAYMALYIHQGTHSYPYLCPLCPHPSNSLCSSLTISSSFSQIPLYLKCCGMPVLATLLRDSVTRVAPLWRTKHSALRKSVSHFLTSLHCHEPDAHTYTSALTRLLLVGFSFPFINTIAI